MNTSRVNQIIQSKDTIEVTYQGNQVWINHLNDNGTATVHHVGQHDEKFNVPISQLQEHHDVQVGG